MKKCKKLTAVFFAVIMLLSVMPIAGIDFFKASALEASGQLTDTISYTFDEATGTLTISGTGDMPDYDDDGPFSDDYYNYYSEIKKIIIEDGITRIGDNAFCWFYPAIVVVPESVTSIGEYVLPEFESCFYYPGTEKQWNEIEFDSGNPDPVLYPEHYLSDTVYYTFDISTFTLTISGEGDMPDYSYRDNISPFASKYRITDVVIEDGITSIGNYAFRTCCSPTSIRLPDSVTSVGDYAFYECIFLEDITIPDSVTSISKEAFYNCDSLESIEIPDSVTSIGERAFDYCTGLTSITIGSGVTSIGDGAFYYCDSLTSITIPDSVTSIGKEAFSDCESLTSIEIPDSVTSIGWRAFGYCDSLTDVYYGGTEEQWNAIEIGHYNNALLNANIHFAEPDDGRVYLNDTVYYTFDEATGTLTISGTGDMPNGTFSRNSSIVNVIIEDGITSIGKNTFKDCYSLKSITIPTSVTSIGDSAFDCCFSLTSITIPTSVTSIGFGAFKYCTGLTSVTIPDSVTSIGFSAFYDCESLTEITIGNGVTNIGDDTFSHCANLTSVTIPDSVTNIGYDAFYDCKSLTSITIPDSVTSIGEEAFGYCDSLTDVYYGGTEEQWNAIEIGDYNECLLNANIRSHVHSYTSEITTPATCTAAGVMTYTCSCGYTYTKAIPAAGHTMDGWFVAVEPTKTVSGVLRRECQNCNYCEEMDMGFAKVDKVKGISLSSNSETLVPGGSVNLEAIISPETADNKNVFWTSSDDTVASVLNGTVIANNIGSAVIIAETEDGGYKDFCLIKVAGITATNSSAVIDNENNLIYGLAPNLASIEEYVELTDEAATFEYDSAVLGTGTVVNIVKNNAVVDSYEVVIFGDVNNDSWYDGTDSVIVNCLANGILSREQVGEAVYTAADCNHDGIIDENDVAILEQAGLILVNVDQSKTAEELFEDAAFCEYLNLISQTVEEDAPVESTESEPKEISISFITRIMKFFAKILNFIYRLFA